MGLLRLPGNWKKETSESLFYVERSFGPIGYAAYFSRSVVCKLVKKKKKGEYRNGELGGWVEQSKMCFLRVQPSGQNHNLEDYQYLLGKIGVIKKRPKPSYHGLRLIRRAYRHFEANLPEDVPSLLALVSKINQLNFVLISVSTQADAFTLFETLNNRGVPLSAIDIIKNKMLAEMEKTRALPNQALVGVAINEAVRMSIANDSQYVNFDKDMNLSL